MSKILKMYIPIVNIGIVQKKRTFKITLVGVHNCSTIFKHLPAVKDIAEHLAAQKYQMQRDPNYAFTSIKVNVSEEEWEEMRKEISRKIGKIYRPQVIDLVFGSGQVPVIQILKEQKSVPVEQLEKKLKLIRETV
jgi:hypothetical protein